MLKVGAVDIDTSHPVEFAPLMRQSGRAAYTCLYNAGFRDDDYVAKFMAEKNVPLRYQSLEEMTPRVDIAFIHSCNWDKHLELAQPFIDAGKPVFIDKPLVGNLADCHKLQSLVKAGATVIGGSSFRYCREFNDFMAQPESQRGQLLSIWASIGVDEFNYGIHAIESLGVFLPSGAHSVKCVHHGAVEIYQVAYKNGVQATYQLCSGIWRPTTAVVTTTKGTFFIQPDTSKLYQAILDYAFDVLEKRRDATPINEMLESIKIALAAKVSRENQGREIKLEDLRLDDPGYDGDAFEAAYAIASR